MFYCENCGMKLPQDAVFCENCGKKVASNKELNNTVASTYCQDIFIFEKADWKKPWKTNRTNAFRAIILTNTSDCNAQQREKFYKSLKEYTDFRRKCGNVEYFVLDMKSQRIVKASMVAKTSSVDFILKVLKEIYSVRTPDYLFIVGDRDAVGSISWNNPLHQSPSINRDSDKTVDSDLPYVTLSITSPFKSVSFQYAVKVGRVPAQAKSGFEQAINYFIYTIFVANTHDLGRDAKPLVLCAEEWQNCSREIFAPNSNELYPCGPYSFVPNPKTQLLRSNTSHNLYCFNLHGSPTMDYWVNGDGCPAYSPQALPINEGYVIGTEACYGAKPIFKEAKEQSILVTAMQSGCLGYLGSTQIAFGISDEYYEPGCELSCADAMVGKFIKYVSEGYSLGASYIKSLKDMLNNDDSKKLRGEECKTLASFALYGDPSLKCFKANIELNESKYLDCEASKDTSIHIVMPDIITAVEARIAKVNQKIAEIIDNFVNTTYPSFSGAKPTYFRLEDNSGYTVSYNKMQNGLTKIMNIYFDDIGNVTDVFVTK